MIYEDIRAEREREELRMELAHYREVMPKLVDVLRLTLPVMECAVRAGLTGFSDEEVEAIVRKHGTCQSIREALALVKRGGG